MHYPPQTFTSVPLRDEPPSAHATPNASGRNTPNGSGNKRKTWTFLPTHSATSLENGTGGFGEKLKRPKNSRGNSWDLLGERAEWEDFNPKNASVENLRFAQGDVGTNKVCCVENRPDAANISSLDYIIGCSIAVSLFDGQCTSFPSWLSSGFQVFSV